VFIDIYYHLKKHKIEKPTEHKNNIAIRKRYGVEQMIDGVPFEAVLDDGQR
jgi:hypothetical protein